MGRATAKKVIGQMINEVADRCDVVMFSLLPKGVKIILNKSRILWTKPLNPMSGILVDEKQRRSL